MRMLESVVCRYLLWRHGCVHEIKPPLGFSPFAMPKWYSLRLWAYLVKRQWWRFESWLLHTFGQSIRQRWIDDRNWDSKWVWDYNTSCWAIAILDGESESVTVNPGDIVVDVEAGDRGVLKTYCGNEVRYPIRANLTTGECIFFATDQDGVVAFDHLGKRPVRARVQCPSPMTFERIPNSQPSEELVTNESNAEG